MAEPLIAEESLDAILAWQFVVAWAGETGDDPRRLGWWRSDLIDDLAGGDFFRRTMPQTAAWAGPEAARHIAMTADAALRSALAQPDRLVTLFHWGPAIDERLADRLAALKRQAASPAEALPIPFPLQAASFSSAGLADCLTSRQEAAKLFKAIPGGRQVDNPDWQDHVHLARQLVAAMVPLTPHYPLPFARSERALPS